MCFIYCIGNIDQSPLSQKALTEMEPLEPACLSPDDPAFTCLESYLVSLTLRRAASKPRPQDADWPVPRLTGQGVTA